jgi:hypothetical protein
VKLTYVRVVERRKHPGFAKKPGFPDRVETLVLPDDLERHPPTENLVETDVDGAHSAVPELPDNPEVAQPKLLGERRLRVCHACILRVSRSPD